MKYIYVINRFNLGDRSDEIIRRLKKASEEFHRDYEIDVRETAEEAAQAASKYKDRECIVTAIGGDGSINLILNDLVGTKNILAFIPIGTGNDFNRACSRTLENGIHDIDIVRINDRYFMNVACFGYDADIANDDRFIHNRFIPKSMRYTLGAVCYFLTYKRGRHLKIECEGEILEQEFLTVVAANNQYYGGGYRISPDSVINDGMMEIYLVDPLNKIRMAQIILSMKKAGHLKNPALKMIRSRKLVLTSDEPFCANIDGEPLQADHFELELIPRGFRIDYNREFIERVQM